MKKALLFLPFLLISCKTVNNSSTEIDSEPVARAYYLQKQAVEQQLDQDSIIGYKAGLTSTAGQQKFSVNEPVAGVLFKSGLAFERNVYQLEHYQKLMLETEIGFILSQDIKQTVIQSNLSDYIERVVPAIELPDLNYPDLSKVTGQILIQTNVASNHVLIGKGKPFSEVSLNGIAAKLTRNGNLVISGHANDAMGDQLVALEWLINRLLKNGYSLKKGDLLITGALGKMIAAERGQYDADFAQLGKLAFSIR